MRRTLAHQIWEIVNVVLAEFIVGNWLLLVSVVFCSNNFIHPPFVTGSSTEHAAHQMEVSVCVVERMKSVETVYAKFFAGNENGSRSTK